MRFLGIDFGTKKIGVAISDKNANFAFPLCILENNKSSIKNISEICEKNKISKIILGKPGGYKGDAGDILEKIEKFKGKIEEDTGLKVFYESEILTTQQAKRPHKDKRGEKISESGDVDASAAALILQSWLDRA